MIFVLAITLYVIGAVATAWAHWDDVQDLRHPDEWAFWIAIVITCAIWPAFLVLDGWDYLIHRISHWRKS